MSLFYYSYIYGFIIKGYTICPLNPELKKNNVFIKVITTSCRHLSNIMTHVKLDANIIGVNIQNVYIIVNSQV